MTYISFTAHRAVVRVAAIVVLLAGTIHAPAQQPASADSLYEIRDSVLIPTRAGGAISAIVVLKKGETRPLPAILFYSPYLQGPSDATFGKISADRGYAGVVAYARGIRTDLDAFVPYERDGDDAYDVIDWISKQIWCDGRVGMFGGSYVGFVQWSTVRRPHPALKTIVPQVAVMPGFDAPMENGVPQGFALSWPNSILGFPPLPDTLNWRWYEKGTSYRSLDSLAGHPNRIFQTWLRHPDYDAYWSSLVPSADQMAKLEIPILCTTGYYDGAQIAAMEYVRQYFRANRNPQLYLAIGPYDHWGGQREKPADTLMGYPIDSTARRSMRGLAFDWFDHVLKGAPMPDLLQDRINFEVMGANEWRHVPTPAAMAGASLKYHLDDSLSGGRGSLREGAPNGARFVEQTVDFRDRINQNNYFTPFIVNDSIDASNGLVFATEPFRSGVTISGAFTGTIVAEIDRKDFDISIAFYEQTPEGKYFYLTRYLGRASYARDNTRRELLVPGRRETIPLRETRTVCKRLEAGSRLVIVLNVNKHPWEEINYGSGKDVHDETIDDAGTPMKVRWYLESSIEVPILGNSR